MSLRERSHGHLQLRLRRHRRLLAWYRASGGRPDALRGQGPRYGLEERNPRHCP